MYKKPDKDVMTFMDFDQPMGLEMDPENRWVKLAELVPWEEFEEKYAKLFPSTTGNVAKPFRLALGSLLVQNKLGCSDRELVEQLTENPYLQYFIGMPGYKAKPPINAGILVLFRKRITMEMLQEVNERMLEEKVIHACPGGAITKEGIDRKACQQYYKKIFSYVPTPDVCGKCYGHRHRTCCREESGVLK